jgi:hypothetical protein
MSEKLVWAVAGREITIGATALAVIPKAKNAAVPDEKRFINKDLQNYFYWRENNTIHELLDHSKEIKKLSYIANSLIFFTSFKSAICFFVSSYFLGRI